MFTQSMIRLIAIVLEKDGEAVTEALLSRGVMQFITTTAVGGDNISRNKSISLSAEKLPELRDVRKRIENLFATANITPTITSSPTTASLPPVTIKDEHSYLDTIINELQKVRDRQQILQSDIFKYEEIKRQTALYGSTLKPDLLNARHSFVTMQLGSVPVKNTDNLRSSIESYPAVIVPVGQSDGQEHCVVITMKRNQEQTNQLLQSNGWMPVELALDKKNVTSDISLSIDGKIQKLRDEQSQLQQNSRSIVIDNHDHLMDSWTRLRVEELRIEIQKTFSHTSRTLLFSGWVPASKRSEVEQALAISTKEKCHIEWFLPEKVSDLNETKPVAPVKLNNPKLFSPFQMLVTNFGIPEYGSIDPTPIVIITYLTMFGIMFADIGQGAVISLVGIAGTYFLGKQSPLRSVAPLLIWCGAASIITGLLFGSFFGFSITRPIWFDFHGIVTGNAHPSSGIASIFDILGITVKFGIVVISCGLLFNWINLFIKKRYIRMLFDKSGIIGGWIYFGGIYCALYMIDHNYQQLPATLNLFLTVLLPALLLFFKAPLHAISHKTPFSLATLMNFVMEWIVELLELFSGYLSNTLSFLRVAGLGIAHVSLMVSFFTMADMVRGPSPTVVSSFLAILLLIAGNIMVIALEGLSAGIQALRLNYYEFFSKFFTDTGKLFNPISLQKQSHI